MEELLKISPCVGDKPSSLRYVYDKINVNIRGLSAMGISSTQYGSLLIPIIMTKLTPELRLRIARETKKEVWEYEIVNIYIYIYMIIIIILQHYYL